MSDYLYPYVINGARAMVFVDGENLAIRYAAMAQGKVPDPTLMVWHEPGVAAWARPLSPLYNTLPGTSVMRKYYYTSVQGDQMKVDSVTDQLKVQGFEAPRVFKKHKERGSKQVDISLATEMLVHASRRHYDIAVLVAGDEDYVPLLKAVKAEGARAHVWFVADGISPLLRREADYYADIGRYFGV